MMSTSPDYVVAIGASAGGLIPLQELVEALPQDLGSIAIVIAQHLSPEYKSMLAEIISRKTNIPVTSIVDGELLEANHIYVTPPNCDAVFKNNRLHTVETTIGGPRPNIDRLFTSMARVYKNKAAGIILSGTGHDGSNGITQIKNAGGLTISQDLKSAKYTGMPQAAINTGKIDIVSFPAEIGNSLTELIYADRPIKITMKASTAGDSFEQGDEITQLLRLLEARVGTNFNNYKQSTVVRRIEKRLKELHFTTVNQYLGYINQHEEELDAFYKYLLIGVTSFFRDTDAFDALARALKENIAAIETRGTIRIWVPGCATGEESVSIAIVVHELMHELNRLDIKLQIFATDINSNALKIARRGIYEKLKVEQLPESIIDRYFEKSDSGYETRLDIKNSILYTRHDLTTNPPFLRLNMISCRNLFIYFNQELQNQLFPVFQYSLNKNGLLFLGKSESIGNYKSYFDTVDAKFRIFKKKEDENAKFARLPAKKPVLSERLAANGHTVTRPNFSVQDMVKETLFTTYDKPYIVIDEHADIIEISGDINSFISIKAGAANINLLKLIKEELHLELRALVLEAVSTKKSITGRLRRLKEKNTESLLRLQVQPLYFSRPGTSYFMVIFDSIAIDEPFLNSGTTTSESLNNADSKRIEELEFELQSNRQHMNTLVEELETTNEELQALNEELQSSNEEMQASNEELETSNEELQATNEELENAYMDLRSITSKLTRQKQMLEQVSLASPDLIAILRGDDFIYEFINPAYQQLFPKRKILGQPLLSVMPEIASQGFPELMTEVRKSKKTIQRNEAVAELDYNNDGKKLLKYFNFSYAPLVSEDSKDADVIVYAVDVTDAVVVRNHAEENAKFFSTLAESMPQKVWVAGKDGLFSYINQTFKDYFDVQDFQPKAIRIDQFIHPEDLESHQEVWKQSLSNKKPYKIQYRLKSNNGSYHWHLCDCRPLLDQNNEANTWICTAIDIHEEKLIERKKDEFMSIASHELKTPLTTIIGYVQLLEEVLEKQDCETALLYTKRTNKALNKISSLVADLLDVTRIETGKLRFTKQKVDFDKLVTETIEDFRPLANTHQLVIEGANTGAFVSADSGRISQVIINLLSNAIKYSPDADRIIIKTFQKNKRVYFEVSDFGIGIPPTYLGKIFDRFFRVNEKNGFDSGLGIGLYITREIIQRHNGNITVTNNDKKGSTFTFQLPVI